MWQDILRCQSAITLCKQRQTEYATNIEEHSCVEELWADGESFHYLLCSPFNHACSLSSSSVPNHSVPTVAVLPLLSFCKTLCHSPKYHRFPRPLSSWVLCICSMVAKTHLSAELIGLQVDANACQHGRDSSWQLSITGQSKAWLIKELSIGPETMTSILPLPIKAFQCTR